MLLLLFLLWCRVSLILCDPCCLAVVSVYLKRQRPLSVLPHWLREGKAVPSALPDTLHELARGPRVGRSPGPMSRCAQRLVPWKGTSFAGICRQMGPVPGSWVSEWVSRSRNLQVLGPGPCPTVQSCTHFTLIPPQGSCEPWALWSLVCRSQFRSSCEGSFSCGFI